MEDSRRQLDSAHQRLLKELQQSRRRVSDLATSRKRIELKLEKLRQAKDETAAQLERARAAGDPRQTDRFSTALMGLHTQIEVAQAEWRESAAQQEPAIRQAQQLQAAVEQSRRGNDEG